MKELEAFGQRMADVEHMLPIAEELHEAMHTEGQHGLHMVQALKIAKETVLARHENELIHQLARRALADDRPQLVEAVMEQLRLEKADKVSKLISRMLAQPSEQQAIHNEAIQRLTQEARDQRAASYESHLANVFDEHIDAEIARAKGFAELNAEFELAGDVDLSPDRLRTILHPGDQISITAANSDDRGHLIDFIASWNHNPNGIFGFRDLSASRPYRTEISETGTFTRHTPSFLEPNDRFFEAIDLVPSVANQTSTTPYEQASDLEVGVIGEETENTGRGNFSHTVSPGDILAIKSEGIGSRASRLYIPGSVLFADTTVSRRNRMSLRVETLKFIMRPIGMRPRKLQAELEESAPTVPEFLK
ncbi:MAG: hypothetical protein AAF413_02945 [Patescibacteria group bacterium]